ncbi:MAG: TMEM165/GDT1 family protein [Scytonematopsis contorta HA4267-MV1]|nr:TMEM165/GDT1 family protein [Scytonematopsis contorta HA4267-MV1]
MKLDSVPLTTNTQSQSENQLQLEDTIELNSPTVAEDCSQKTESPLVIFGTTFITIFLAEIGDKTQLSTLLMSAESHSPWVVFFGSAAALITTSLLGVLLGSWIACRLSPKTVEKAAGVMLLFISIMLFWDILFA